MVNKAGMYRSVIIGIFNKYYQPGVTEFNFLRSDIQEIANQYCGKHTRKKQLSDRVDNCQY